MRFTIFTLLLALFLTACSAQWIPRGVHPISDPEVQAFLEREIGIILPVTEQPNKKLTVYLAEFDPYLTDLKNLGGYSSGQGYISFSHVLVKRAFSSKEGSAARWRLRFLIAHELGHDMLDHYAKRHLIPAHARELEADAKAFEYWKKLGWDCHIIRKRFEDTGGVGGTSIHSNHERLEQARRLCP